MVTNPYEGYKLYGPYVHRFSKRKVVYLRKNKDEKIIYLNYARYLMEMHLGERLSTHYDVHHINGDKTDDRVENLEVVHRVLHTYNDAVRRMATMKRNKSGQFAG